MIAAVYAGMSVLEILIALLLIAIWLIGKRRWLNLVDAVIEGISRFRGGGPGSPSHPLPADDSRLINRRRKPRRDSEE